MASPAAAQIAYIYDEVGRLVGVVDPIGDTGVYSYDAVGNLLSISRQSSSNVSIIDFTPHSGPVGTTVTISGRKSSGTRSGAAGT
jgi:YD repeat-containing protein